MACIWLLPSAALAQRIDPAQVVADHYPARLRPEEPRDRHSCHKVTDAAPNGDVLRIVAGYTDTSTAAFRVLARQPSRPFEVSYESPASLATFGLFCDIRLIDLDGDGDDDVLFDLHQGRGSTTWVFRRTATGFDHVTPMSPSGALQISSLHHTSIVDLDHDDTRQLATTGGLPEREGGRVTYLPEIYRMRGGSLVLDSEALVIRDFAAGDSVGMRTVDFHLKDGASGPYEMRIVNGIRGGARRAARVSIRINGVDVPGAAKLTDRVEFLTIPIAQPLENGNELEVIVSGPSDATVLIVMRPRS